MIKLAVYGSLRYGNYNYERVLKLFPKQFNLLQGGVIAGYKMFDLGHYPAVVPTGNVEDEILVDIIECGEEPYKYIQFMEYGAGYKDVKITVNGTYECILYYMNAIDLIPYSEVKSGDWNKYLDEINT